MTTEQIAAGPELDALVAEKVMGWPLAVVRGEEQKGPQRIDRIPFSTSWEGAGLVVERMRELGWQVRISTLMPTDADLSVDRWGWSVLFRRGPREGGGGGDDVLSAPEAICRAALAAVGAEAPA